MVRKSSAHAARIAAVTASRDARLVERTCVIEAWTAQEGSARGARSPSTCGGRFAINGGAFVISGGAFVINGAAFVINGAASVICAGAFASCESQYRLRRPPLDSMTAHRFSCCNRIVTSRECHPVTSTSRACVASPSTSSVTRAIRPPSSNLAKCFGIRRLTSSRAGLGSRLSLRSSSVVIPVCASSLSVGSIQCCSRHAA